VGFDWGSSDILIRVIVPLTDEARAERSDAELLSAFSRGDPQALGDLFDRHHAAVYRFLSRLSGSRAPDLDDLVQMTFLEVARSSARFDGRAQFRTWLFGIAVNVARHEIRSRMRERRAFGDAGGERPSEIPGLDRPDVNAERREILARLERSIRELPDTLREIFVACEIEDLPGAEVARELGIPEGTLWRRLYDARKRIRAAVEGEDS